MNNFGNRIREQRKLTVQMLLETGAPKIHVPNVNLENRLVRETEAMERAVNGEKGGLGEHAEVG
jgi:hypothetical protein